MQNSSLQFVSEIFGGNKKKAPKKSTKKNSKTKAQTKNFQFVSVASQFKVNFLYLDAVDFQRRINENY